MKFSKQREMIFEYVKSVSIHSTAETIYKEIRKNEKISLGTVYRNLDKLADTGVIKKIKIANTKDWFDGKLDHHYHDFCKKCNKIVDIYISYYLSIDSNISKKHKINCIIL